MGRLTNNLSNFILENFTLPLPSDIELANAEDGAISVSIKVRQYTTQKELKALIPYAIKWRDAAFRWNGGHRKDGNYYHIESIHRMHTSAGGRWTYSQIANYLSELIVVLIRSGEWDDAREILIDTLHFTNAETDDLLDVIARPELAEGKPPFPEGYPPVTTERLKRRLRTWRDKREPKV